MPGQMLCKPWAKDSLGLWPSLLTHKHLSLLHIAAGQKLQSLHNVLDSSAPCVAEAQLFIEGGMALKSQAGQGTAGQGRAGAGFSAAPGAAPSSYLSWREARGAGGRRGGR